MRACAEFVGYVIITLMRAIKLFFITTLLTLAGCATGPEASTTVASSPTAPASAAPALDIDDSAPPYADIPHEQLHQLLEAEFAIRARDLELGLEKLLSASLALPDPAVARRALQLAQFLRDRDAILSMAQRVSDLAPEDAEAATFAAALLIERGDIVTALPYSKRAFASSSDINPAALLNGFKAQAAETQRLIKDLIIELGDAYPNEPRTLFAKALLAWREGEATASEGILMTLLSIEPYHERGTLLLTEIRSRTDEETAFDYLLEAIEATNSPLLRYQYARFLTGKQRLTEAKQQFDVLVEIAPENIDYAMGAALLDLELDQPAAALVILDRVISLQQRLDDAYLYRGIALARLGDSTGALDALAKVGDSQNLTAALREATKLLLDDGREAAINTFFKAHRTAHPSGREVNFIFHADALNAVGSTRAVDILSEGVASLSNSIRLLFARASLLERAGRFEAAESDYRSVLALRPGDAGALNALGYALTNNTERFSEAATLLEEAISKDPRNPAIIDSLGWVYFKLGKNRQAEALLKEAYQQYPDPEVAAHLIELLWSVGREIEARDLMVAHLKSSPNNPMLINTAIRLAIPLPK
jgi:tetratricopeptide (TPR) repeat protein